MAMQQERLPHPIHAEQHLPSAPTHDIVSPNRRLPDLRSLCLPVDAVHDPPPSHANWQRNGAYSPTPHFQPTSSVPARPVVADAGSPMEVSSQMSTEDLRHRDLSVSMEDADVRMAAEALSGLGNPDFLRSPRTASFPHHAASASASASSKNPTLSPENPHAAVPQSPTLIQSAHQPSPVETEPLLRLITDSHPWLGNTISGSMIAYDGAKHYSPRFVRGTAEFMERNIGTPMVSTVGYVSRHTGVDGRIRKYLGDRRLSDDGRANGPESKRRRVSGMSGADEAQDVERGIPKDHDVASPPDEGHRMRADSRASHHSAVSGVESLPAYDENRSPVYEEYSPSRTPNEKPPQHAETQPERAQQRSLTSQVLETTAGLGVALSDSSLRSLKYSLRVLGGASEHISVVMQALKRVLEEYEQDQKCDDLLSANEKQLDGQAASSSNSLSAAQKERSDRLARKIKELGDNIWIVLRQTIGTISRYTGSALPENAASLVRRQLMSLPLRWRNAAVSGSRSSSAASNSGSPSLEAQQGDSQVVMGANRMMNFGKESLEMLSQVSMVVGGTVRSAEQWLDSMGRQKRQDSGVNGESVESASTTTATQPQPGMEQDVEQKQQYLHSLNSPPQIGGSLVAGQQ